MILGAVVGGIAGAASPAANDGAHAATGGGQAAGVGGSGGLVDGVRSGAGTGSTPAQVDNESVGGPVNTTMTVVVRPNGDARWSVRTYFRLRTEADVESFQQLGSAFQNGETADLGFGAFERGASLASEATGRQMSIRDPVRNWSLPSDTPGNASLRLAFTWTNFGETTNETVVIGDVFDTDPLWLRGLTSSQELRLRPPQGWEMVESPGVPLRNRALVWEGPADFDGDDVSATFGSGEDENGQNGNGDGTDEGPDLLVLIGGGLLILVAALLAYGVYRRSGEAEDGEEPAAGAAAPDADEAGADAEEDEEAEDAESVPADEDTVDTELLSDEERIERLLEENGGRMKQANIVKETGWSNAKVSQLLSAMDEEDRIDKLRIGRENLISFPEEDVTDVEE